MFFGYPETAIRAVVESRKNSDKIGTDEGSVIRDKSKLSDTLKNSGNFFQYSKDHWEEEGKVTIRWVQEIAHVSPSLYQKVFIEKREFAE